MGCGHGDLVTDVSGVRVVEHIYGIQSVLVHCGCAVGWRGAEGHPAVMAL